MFVQVGGRFCRFVESAHTMGAADQLRGARTALADLVAAGSRLPQGEPQTPDIDLEDPDAPEWRGFPKHDYYWVMLDPFDFKSGPDEPGTGSLSDDLLDIYRDVKRGFVAVDRGRLDLAAWEWRFHFDCHWGDHAVDALRMLHRACSGLTDAG